MSYGTSVTVGVRFAEAVTLCGTPELRAVADEVGQRLAAALATLTG